MATKVDPSPRPPPPDGQADAFTASLKTQMAVARSNMMNEISVAVNNWMQVQANELLATHEAALDKLLAENACLKRQLAGEPEPAPLKEEPGTGSTAPPMSPAGEQAGKAMPGNDKQGSRSASNLPNNDNATLPGNDEDMTARGSYASTLVSRGLKSLKTAKFHVDDEPTRVDPGSCSAKIVRSQYFEAFFCAVIILNCFSMGVEAHFMVQEDVGIMEAPLEFMEHAFTVLFTTELLLRLWVYGWKAFVPNREAHIWNFLDFVLVAVTGILFGWIVPPLAASLGIDSGSSFLRTLTVFRAFRLLRLVRVIRKVHAFREVYLLLRGLSNSMRILLWTCIVIFFVTYVFAVFGLWLISKGIRQDYSMGPTEELESVLGWVGGLDTMLGTLIQVLTLDSWTGKVEIIMKYSPWCWLYFYAYIAVAVFVLMNLVTAIIVENAMATSREEADHKLQEKEKQMQREMEELKTLFSLMDTDGGGTLDWSEFQQSFSNERMRRRWNLLDFNPTECHELFNLLDNGDGEIVMDEFFEGLQKMKGQAQSRDLVRLTKNIDRLSSTVVAMAHTLGTAGHKGDLLHSPTFACFGSEKPQTGPSREPTLPKPNLQCESV